MTHIKTWLYLMDQVTAENFRNSVPWSCFFFHFHVGGFQYQKCCHGLCLTNCLPLMGSVCPFVKLKMFPALKHWQCCVVPLLKCSRCKGTVQRMQLASSLIILCLFWFVCLMLELSLVVLLPWPPHPPRTKRTEFFKEKKQKKKKGCIARCNHFSELV